LRRERPDRRVLRHYPSAVWRARARRGDEAGARDGHRNRNVKTLRAEGVVEHSPEEVYRFLERLENHWRLNDDYLRVESLRADRRGPRSASALPAACPARREPR